MRRSYRGNPPGALDYSWLVKRIRTFGAVLSLALALVTACGSATMQGRVQTTPAPIAHLAGGPATHIAVILMENEEYGSIIGSPATPYINGLARHYALASSMYAITHPSLPNYLALTGGSTFGITSDCTDCTVGQTSIVDQLTSAHISWKAYMEGLPHAVLHRRRRRRVRQEARPVRLLLARRRSAEPLRARRPAHRARDRRARAEVAHLHLDHAEPVPRHARLLPRGRRPVPLGARAAAPALARVTAASSSSPGMRAPATTAAAGWHREATSRRSWPAAEQSGARD